MSRLLGLKEWMGVTDRLFCKFGPLCWPSMASHVYSLQSGILNLVILELLLPIMSLVNTASHGFHLFFFLVALSVQTISPVASFSKYKTTKTHLSCVNSWLLMRRLKNVVSTNSWFILWMLLRHTVNYTEIAKSTLGKTRHVLKQKTLYILFCSMVLSYFNYYVETCGNTYAYCRKRPERIGYIYKNQS